MTDRRSPVRALMGVSEASQFLGVSEAALRQWTDEGCIKAFITPGGHRRYSIEELNRLVVSHHKPPGIKQLMTGLQETVEAHREIDRTRLQALPWYGTLSEPDRGKLAGGGRLMLSLIVRYVGEPSRRGEVIVLCREAGKFFGETLAKLGLPLNESVKAFIMHREPLIKAATDIMKHKDLSERVLGAIPLVDRIMDEALVSLVAAHQSCRESGGGGPA